VSIIFGKGITSAQPGSVDRLVLSVYDIDAARRESSLFAKSSRHAQIGIRGNIEQLVVDW
jgi:hypothetical protein